MLYLTRKIGESVIINDNIEITVVEVRGRSIKLGFTFPPDVSVLRREIYDRIQEENREAAGAGAPPALPADLTAKLKTGDAPKLSTETPARKRSPVVVHRKPRAPRRED